ncbi:helix-turn-helix domain-containing protein [Qipengyuania sp. 1XM1-15A]|uniref:helix-turn-helix domain-containing protein n=1 Tax=Qipengyuania xiamenensis TaxID=2867237 RepID=UPI001C8762D7|nr:helix-turn-helix transcriptional regulator [Qipengyuania xiamenensis]MBX7532049.1 helix-turn-helix domain-containing protein [Qipengyuania xiamenensis]
MAKSMHTAAWAKLLEQLVEMRLTRGLTQQDLAERIERTQSFISKIERGERRLDVLEFCEWMHALGHDPADVISLLAKEV